MPHLTREAVEAAATPLRRRHRADPADGVGREGRRPAPARAGPRRAMRSSGRRGRCAWTASTWTAFSRRRVPAPTWRSTAQRHLHPRRWPPTSASALGGCAHLAALRRLRVGSFTLDECHPLERSRPTRRLRAGAGRGRAAPRRAGRRRRRRRRASATVGVLPDAAPTADGPVRRHRPRRRPARRLRAPARGLGRASSQRRPSRERRRPGLERDATDPWRSCRARPCLPSTAPGARWSRSAPSTASTSATSAVLRAGARPGRRPGPGRRAGDLRPPPGPGRAARSRPPSCSPRWIRSSSCWPPPACSTHVWVLTFDERRRHGVGRGLRAVRSWSSCLRRPGRGRGRRLPLRPPAEGQRRAARAHGRRARLRRPRR